MKILGEHNGVYLFAPLKKEGTSSALDKISDIMNDHNLSYIGIISETDARINGYIDLVHQLDLDFTKYNLIIVKPDLSTDIDIRNKR